MPTRAESGFFWKFQSCLRVEPVSKWERESLGAQPVTVEVPEAMSILSPLI